MEMRGLVAAVLGMLVALGVGDAVSQTTAGIGTTIVFPVTAQTGSFASEVTVFNPGPNALTAHMTFFEANNSATPGTKVCTDAAVPANRKARHAREPAARVLHQRHMGPVAQDFRAAFGLGYDEITISGVDLDGVALAAIQGLHQIVREKDARIAALEIALEELKRSVEALTRSK